MTAEAPSVAFSLPPDTDPAVAVEASRLFLRIIYQSGSAEVEAGLDRVDRPQGLKAMQALLRLAAKLDSSTVVKVGGFLTPDIRNCDEPMCLLML